MQSLNLDWTTIRNEATGILSRLIQFDTTNPPGHERPAAEYLLSLLEKEGIQGEILESAPGRANLLARRRGSGEAGPLLLLGHTDVVYADPTVWQRPPFSGLVEDGFIWGRGALDMKGLVVMELMTLILCHRLDLPLKRDLLLLAVADEEALGKFGAAWLVDHHWDKIAAEYVLNEGGEGVHIGGRTLYLVATGEKGYADFRLTATGRGGHSSRPEGPNPIVTLARGLSCLGDYHSPLTPTPTMDRFLQKLGQHLGNPTLTAEHVNELISQGILPPFLKYALRNVFSPTVINAGQKNNVIPPRAVANVNCRMLPGVGRADIESEIRAALAEEDIRLEITEFNPASESPTHTALFDVIEHTLECAEPGCLVLPFLMPAATDSRFFRARGVTAYGLTPIALNLDEYGTVHSSDERISVENLERGTRHLFEIVRQFCGANNA